MNRKSKLFRLFCQRGQIARARSRSRGVRSEQLEHRVVLSSISVSGSTLVYSAQPGEANNITISESAGVITVIDTGATISTGAGSFTIVSPNEVTIPVAGLNNLAVAVGDMNDSVDASGVGPASGLTNASFGNGAGNDTFVGTQLNDLFNVVNSVTPGVNSIDGQGGSDAIGIAADTDITLTNSTFTVGSDTSTVMNVERPVLAGGIGDNVLDASAVTAASDFIQVSFNNTAGNDTMIGSQLNDSFNIVNSTTPGTNIIDGQGGSDSIGIAADTDITLTNSTFTVGSDTSTVMNVERPVLAGGAGDNVLNASAVTSASDYVQVTFNNTPGNDTMIGSQINDGFNIVNSTTPGTNIIDGQGGTDIVGITADTNITLTDSSFTVGADTSSIVGLERINAAAGAGNNVLDASAVTGAGDLEWVRIDGRDGDDTLVASTGVQTTAVGGSGFDTLDLTSATVDPNVVVTGPGTIDGDKGTFAATSVFDDINDILLPDLNDAPELTSVATDATFADKARPGDLVSLTATFVDPDGADTHTAVIDWGDGTTSAGVVDSLAGTITATHVYATGGLFEVSVTVTDAAGETDDLGTTSVVRGVRLADTGELQIIGSDFRDHIYVWTHGTQIKTHVHHHHGYHQHGHINSSFNASSVQAILVHACGHNDRVLISHGVQADATVHAGAGRDWIEGGSGNDIILGGTGGDSLDGNHGNDVIVGGGGWDIVEGDSGDDILIGGTGADLIKGGSGEDLLIGGTTDHDDDIGALQSVFSEWTSPNTFADRVNDLSTGLLSPGSVHDDNVRDWMKGGSSSDWYFADVSGWDRDRLFGFSSLDDELTVIV